MGMCEGEVEESKVLTELVYSFNSSMKKVDWTKDLTEELNSKRLEVKRNLNEWKKKRLYRRSGRKKDMRGRKIEFNVDRGKKKGQKISMMMIKNFTTSSKNAIKVVEEGELKEWPVRKGINLHKNTLIFLLEGSESFRRVMWFLVLAYKMDEVNQKYIEELKKEKELDKIIDSALEEYAEKEGVKNIEIKEFKQSKEMKVEEGTMIEYIVSNIKEKKEW